MKTYIMMTKIAPQDANIIDISHRMQAHNKNSSIWMDEIKKACPGVRIIANYALLGPYDFMCIYEAPDEKTAAKVSLMSRAHGAFQVESWNAIPSNEISDLVDGLVPGVPRTREY